MERQLRLLKKKCKVLEMSYKMKLIWLSRILVQMLGKKGEKRRRVLAGGRK